MAVLRVCMPVTWVVAGLDVGRLHLSHGYPPALQVAGLAVCAAGFWIVARAMWVNPFFSSAVRLQPDRHQSVVRRGPYAAVRHPGYSGGVLFTFGTGLVFGSWWALLPAVPMVVALVRRVRIEDAMLRSGLPGYEAYARAVRFRLFPGIW